MARLVSFIEGLKSGHPPDLAGQGDGAPGSGPGLAELAELAKTYFAPEGPLFKALTPPGGALADEEVWHSPRLHAAEIPAANGICDARSLARLYGACVSDVVTSSGDPFRILTPEQLARAMTQETEGPDRVLLGLDIQWGLGFNVNAGMIAPGRARRPECLRALRHGGLSGLGGP